MDSTDRTDTERLVEALDRIRRLQPTYGLTAVQVDAMTGPLRSGPAISRGAVDTKFRGFLDDVLAVPYQTWRNGLEPALLYSFRKRAGVHYEAAKLMLEREGPESRVFDVLERDGGGLTARQLNQKIRGMEGQEVTDALTGLEAAGRIQSRVQGRAVLWAVASA